VRVFENIVLRRIFCQKRDEATGDGKNCVMMSFITCNRSSNIIRMTKSMRMGWPVHVERMGEGE
jgi:hypothetical protein